MRTRLLFQRLSRRIRELVCGEVHEVKDAPTPALEQRITRNLRALGALARHQRQIAHDTEGRTHG